MGARGRRTAERRGPKPQHTVALTAPEYRELQRLTRRRTAPYAEVVRAKILLLAYEHPDWSNAAIARAVGCTDRTVRKRPTDPRFLERAIPILTLYEHAQALARKGHLIVCTD